jgi:hypothetical protein
MSYGEVLGDKSTVHIMVTLYCRYLIILRPLHLDVSCTVVVLTCFVMCGCVCVDVLVICVFVFTVFCTVCTVFFVLFLLCIFILICFVCTGVRTTATE